jgi:hypothetical protein
MSEAIAVGGDGGAILHLLSEQHAKVLQAERELAILRNQNAQYAAEFKKLAALFLSEPEWKGADGEKTSAIEVIGKIIERYRVDNANLTDSLRIANEAREILASKNSALMDDKGLGDPDETE